MNTPTLALPPFATLHELPTGEWVATCLACPGSTQPRPDDEAATRDAHHHWKVWHATREDRTK